MTPEARSPALADYREGSFYYTSPRHSLLAEGVAREIPAPGGSWAPAVAATLAPGEIAVGAIGFDPAACGRLVVPDRVVREGPLRTAGLPATAPVFAPHRRWGMTARPAPAEFERGVADAVERIDAGSLHKVVLARSLALTAPAPVPVAELLARLARQEPRGHVFAVDVTRPGDAAPRTLIGASPELLVSRTGRAVTANPLAGSAPRSTDPVEDRRRATALAASEKDRHEHALVIDEVVRVLREHCDDVVAPPEPFVVRTAAMWHLSSRVTGRLGDPSMSSLALAESLHPTPAVGGLPVAAAQEAISAIEGADRGYYAGLVGWCDAAGDGEWAVTIRCAEVTGRALELFAGVGVVAGSVPADELAETSGKFRTLLTAIGVEVSA